MPHLFEVQLLQLADAERLQHLDLRGEGAERSAHRQDESGLGTEQRKQRGEDRAMWRGDARRTWSFVKAAAADPAHKAAHKAKSTCRIFLLGHERTEHSSPAQPASLRLYVNLG